MTLKWKRLEPGRYQCGDWTIAGKGTKWGLYNDAQLVKSGDSKGELQRYVEKGPSLGDVEPEVPSRRRAGVDSLESVLASLRLEVNELTLAVRMLTARLDGR